MASALDRLIDQACGIKPGDLEMARRQWVTMRCPACKKETRARKHETDPEGTAVVQADCPGCTRAGSKECAVKYFGADGRELKFESEAATPIDGRV